VHPLFEQAAGLTETSIAAAIEVHRDKGPGLIESIYEWCLLKNRQKAYLRYFCWLLLVFSNGSCVLKIPAGKIWNS
jgi:PD-(D/E)XK nuclease superfamily